MILGEDFMFMDSMKTETIAIKLLTEPYKDIVYRYTKLNVKENDDDSATLSFSYELYEMGDNTETSLRKDEKFHQHIGLVLNSLILEAVEHVENTQKKEVK